MGRRGLRLITLAAIPVLVLSACSGSSSTSAPAQATGTTGPVGTPTAPPVVGPVTVTWFVGLGSGTQPNQIDAQKTFVTNYNKSQSAIVLKLEIVPNTNAYDVLKTEIAAGNAPDIIGPVGVKGRNGFEGLFLDQTAEIAKQNFDLTQYDPALVKFFNDPTQGQVGIPYDIFPAFVFYNKDLFAKAGLPDLPTKVGDQYQGADWNWDNLSTIATELTLDKNNKKPTDAGFDPNNIVQFGVDFQWADGRRMASCFGGASFVAADGKTAQIPQVWADAFNWYYNAMWKNHFAPTGKYISSALLNSGTTVSSGRIAMDVSWGWAINSFGTAGKTTFKAWDMAVMPDYKGAVSAPIDSDTFTIAKASKNPDQAFQAMVAIMAEPTLMQVYGGEPAKTADQAAYFKAFDTTLATIWPGNQVTWSVLAEDAKYPTTPSHESNMPNFLQASSDYGVFYTKLQNTAGLDVTAELTKLQATLQTDFDNSQIVNF